MTCAWCTRRSMVAAATTSSPRVSPRRENDRFEVRMIEPVSADPASTATAGTTSTATPQPRRRPPRAGRPRRSSSEPASPSPQSSPTDDHPAGPAPGPQRVRRRCAPGSNPARTPRASRRRGRRAGPPGVVVSIDSCNERNPTPRSANPRTVSIKWGSDRPNRSKRHTVRGVPRAQCGHHLYELRTLGPGPRRGVGPRPPAARGAQRVVLQRRVLHRGRHPRVPQQLPHEQRQCHNPYRGT